MNDVDFLRSLKPARFPSPCFIVDEARLRANAAILDTVQRRTGAKILLALKGFAMWDMFPILSRSCGSGPLYGCCASSPDEARLAREQFGGEVHAFAAAFSDTDMREIAALADHIVFNSFSQWRQFRELDLKSVSQCRTLQFGLRINPEHSEGAVAIYNPCSPQSRLGIRPDIFADNWQRFSPPADDKAPLSGLHFHTLCEQGAEELDRTLNAVEKHFGSYLNEMQWLNFGGGHHITKSGYNLDLLCRCIERMQKRYDLQIYLEPGEAVALNAGYLVSTVLDVIMADKPIAILDTSAAAHMPDVLEMPYRPHVFGSGQPGEKSWTCRLAGKSCLAGDVIGEYSFDASLRPGDKIVFADMAIYSMVKTTTFNGLRLPSIIRWSSDTDCWSVVRQFAYRDFMERLS
ncbi:MAG: carboxynorspermidine decarboxylase [Desulfovibrionaceae bacterium]|nr:carboxynorspermidine decarboxylase [Desulfovibrionaceae bacterium]